MNFVQFCSIPFTRGSLQKILQNKRKMNFVHFVHFVHEKYA